MEKDRAQTPRNTSDAQYNGSPPAETQPISSTDQALTPNTVHDILCHGISLGPVQVTCPGHAPQLLVQLLSGRARDTKKSLI